MTRFERTGRVALQELHDRLYEAEKQLAAERERADALAAQLEQIKAKLAETHYPGAVLDEAAAIAESGPATALAQRDLEQQKVGATSFKAELCAASVIPVRIHAEGVFAVWLHKTDQIAAGVDQ